MKLFSTILFFVITLLQTTNLVACSCNESSFCGSVDDTTSVVKVEVIDIYSISSGNQYADVKIIETLQNGIAQDTITISGVILTSCDKPLPSMNIGDTLLINFPELIFPFMDANHPAFQLNICDIRILQFSAGIVTGNIQPDLSSMSYDDFITTLGECADFTNSIEDLNYLENEITISPNPFSENVNIDFGNLATSKISIELFSAQGQIITSIQNLQQYTYKLHLSDFPKGIYFVKIQYRNESIVKKIVKI